MFHSWIYNPGSNKNDKITDFHDPDISDEYLAYVDISTLFVKS